MKKINASPDIGQKVFENDRYTIVKLLEIEGRDYYGSSGENVYAFSIDEEKYPDGEGGYESLEILAVVSPDCKKICRQTFNKIKPLGNYMTAVYQNGCGWGAIDQDMEIVVPLIYEDIDIFKGSIEVCKGGEWRYLNGDGTIGNASRDYAGNEKGYKIIERLDDGCAIVARDADGSGEYLYGVVDENGALIIPAIYNGLSLQKHCGEWKNGLFVAMLRDPKWREQYGHDRFYGVVDKNGRTIVPCVYVEVQIWGYNKIYGQTRFNKEPGALFDRQGNLLAKNDKFVLDTYNPNGLTVLNGLTLNDEWVYGVYDNVQKKTLFEPQFSECRILDDGRIYVETTDYYTDIISAKIIDTNGVECFNSPYSRIYVNRAPYEAVITYDDGSELHGLIEEDGKVILPCEYEEVGTNPQHLYQCSTDLGEGL